MTEPGQPRKPEPRDRMLSSTMIGSVLPDFKVDTGHDELDYMEMEVVGGPMDGLSVRVSGETLTVGRGTHNDLPLPLDPMVSSHHARIEREGQHFWLEDLDSRNGTYLGDKRIEDRVLLGFGTTFLVGQTRLEFMPR